MMTPADELEQIVKEIAVYDEIDFTKSYTIKSFPEIFFLKYKFYYMVEIMKDYRENDEIIKRFEELRDEIESRKIIFKNQIFDIDRKLLCHGNGVSTYVPIYYEDCVFTSSPYDGIGEYCENCIVEGGET